MNSNAALDNMLQIKWDWESKSYDEEILKDDIYYKLIGVRLCSKAHSCGHGSLIQTVPFTPSRAKPRAGPCTEDTAFKISVKRNGQLADFLFLDIDYRNISLD